MAQYAAAGLSLRLECRSPAAPVGSAWLLNACGAVSGVSADGGASRWGTRAAVSAL